MGLLAEALAHHEPVGPCRVVTQVGTLDAATRAEFDDYVQAVREWRVTHGDRTPGGPNARELYKALRKLRLACSILAIQDHIAGRCGCG